MNEIQIDAQGDLAGILMIFSTTKNPAGGAGFLQVKIGCGK